MENENRLPGINGMALKYVAMVCMFIDHFGATVMLEYLRRDYAFFDAGRVWYSTRTSIIYFTCRFIGRIAFPIFCFMMVEGYVHTKNFWKYVLRILIFSVISEIPFDMAFNYSLLEFTSQNVGFTFLISLLTIRAYHMILYHTKFNSFIRMNLSLLALAAGLVVAYFFKADYGAFGVFCVLMLYLFRTRKKMQFGAGMVSFAVSYFPSELPALLAFIPLWFYNGEKGKGWRYTFYVFYPLHILILAVIRNSIFGMW